MLTEPKQDRSRKSRDQLIEAASSLAAEKGFDQMSLREVCLRAGLTSGAFYARFSKKEDLALALVERLGEELLQPIQYLAGRLDNLGFEPAVRALLGDYIDLYRRQGRLFRAVIAVARSHPEVARELRLFNDRLFGDLLQLVAPIESRLSHPSPKRALTLGFLAVFNTLRELILEQQLYEKEREQMADDVLLDELLRMLVNYLGLDSGRGKE